jgi:arabinogalactan endo-1,4-beta-galactosidase
MRLPGVFALAISCLAAFGCGERGDLLGTITRSADGGGEPAARSSPSFFIGADITFVAADEAAGATYSDGVEKDILRLLGDHGFNYVRLRTFVDPRAADGYDKQNGAADLAHTIAFARRVKAADMGFLLNFHYSDNWADPGKQCVPVAWQGMTFPQMVQALHDYTRDSVAALVAAGARPDIVQLGNEITPGMLLHLCDENGLPTGASPVNGSALNWSNLGQLLKAGATAVTEVDAGIRIMLHIDRGGDKPTDEPGYALRTSIGWVENAIAQGVPFDLLGESAYQRYQGDPASAANTVSTWSSTFAGLAARFSELDLVAVEYGPMQREINDVVFNLPGQQGLGTFVWEPTRQGTWNLGHALFSAAGARYTATADLTLYDAMKRDYASRL